MTSVRLLVAAAAAPDRVCGGDGPGEGTDHRGLAHQDDPRPHYPAHQVRPPRSLVCVRPQQPPPRGTRYVYSSYRLPSRNLDVSTLSWRLYVILTSLRYLDVSTLSWRPYVILTSLRYLGIYRLYWSPYVIIDVSTLNWRPYVILAFLLYVKVPTFALEPYVILTSIRYIDVHSAYCYLPLRYPDVSFNGIPIYVADY